MPMFEGHLHRNLISQLSKNSDPKKVDFVFKPQNVNLPIPAWPTFYKSKNHFTP